MSEPRSCANCKYSYVDDLFYEWQCRRLSRPDLDEFGDPVEDTKCKCWEVEQ